MAHKICDPEKSFLAFQFLNLWKTLVGPLRVTWATPLLSHYELVREALHKRLAKPQSTPMVPFAWNVFPQTGYPFM